MDIDKWINAISLTASTVPLYRQIADTLAAHIREEQWPNGAKLPPERDLAERLGVSRTTVINAYRHLEEQDLVVSRVGSGTYVTGSPVDRQGAPPATLPWPSILVPAAKTFPPDVLRGLVAPPAEDTISLAVGMPDPDLYPAAVLRELWCKQEPDGPVFGHLASEGYDPLRRSIARLQAERGISAALNEVLVLSGSQQGIYLMARVLIEPQDCVVVESPTYIGALQVFQSAGARILSLPRVDPFPFDMLENYLARYRPKLFYTTPTFQNPTGSTLSPDDRRELVRLAARYRLIVLEDDPYSELYYDRQPPPPLKAYGDYEGLIYMSTFSKILFPGLRVGWLTAPATLVYRLALEKQCMDLHTNNLTQWLFSRYLEEGCLTEHLARLRGEYRTRRDAMVAALRRGGKELIHFTTPAGGFYLWCRLHPPLSGPQLLQEAVKQAVAVTPGEAFYANGFGADEFRICFARHGVAQLQEGIRRLAKAFRNVERLANPDDSVPRAGYPLV